MRLTCCVPFCRRTTGRPEAVEWPDDVWICGPHWKAVPAEMKAVKRRARAALRRYQATPNTPVDGPPLRRYLRVGCRVTRAAIEIAAGISS